MALASMDDKLLGEKVHSYCSSSEDEDDDTKDSGDEGDNKEHNSVKGPTYIPASKSGRTVQTGPKGVLEDWRRYKQLETEKRERDAAEKDALCRKLAMTCQSFKEEQDSKKKEKANELDISDDDDNFMEWYKQKRIMEMQQKFAQQWAKVAFGDVHELTRDNYVQAIEDEKKFVTILIHIYDTKTPACAAVNGCFKVLAKKYKATKFCRINVAEAKMSSNFIENGLPTIIAYKENTIIGNFVRVSDTLGDDFFASDLEEFLLEYGMLPSSHELPEQSD